MTKPQAMDPRKRAALEAAGWTVGDLGEFLGLSEAEVWMIDFRLAIGRAIRERRTQRGFSQGQLARILQTSQPRLARIEAAAPDVSLDLMVRALLVVGGSVEAVVRGMGGAVPPGAPPATPKPKGAKKSSPGTKGTKRVRVKVGASTR